MHEPACVLVRRHAAGLDLHISDPTMENTGLIVVDLPDRDARLVTADPEVSFIRKAGTLRVSVAVAGSGGRTFRASLRTLGDALGLLPVPAAADVSVSQGTSTMMSGAEPLLEVTGEGGANWEALLRFDLTALSGPPLATELRVVPITAIPGQRHRLSSLEPGNWQEQTVTWATRPVISEPIADWSPATEKPGRLDVSGQASRAFATGTPLVFSIHDLAEGMTGTGYASREHPDQKIRPQLLVVQPHPDTVGLSLSRTTISEGGGTSSLLSVFRSGDVSGALELDLTASGTAIEGGHLSGLPETLVIPAGERSVEVALVAVDDQVVNPNRWLDIAIAAPPAPWLLAPDHTATLVILDDDTGPFRRFDTFDVGSSPTTGDDAEDPDDIAWTRTPSSSTFNVSEPDDNFGGGRTLHFAPGATFGKLFGQLPALPFSMPGHSYQLAFRAKYQTQPATNSGGFRFGLFNSKGDGYFIYQGTGDHSGFSALRDFGGDGGFSSGSTTGAVTWAAIGQPSGFGSAAVREFRFNLTRSADGGVRIEASVDRDLDGISDYSLLATDPTSLIDDISRVVISNGGISQVFRVDDVLVEKRFNRPPWFLMDPIRPQRLRVGRDMILNLAELAFDPDTGEHLTFDVTGLPSWLEATPDGRLRGTPGTGDAGEHVLDVGVTDTSGLAARAELILTVDRQPAFLEWASSNNVDPHAADSLVAFVFGHQPGMIGDGSPRLLRAPDGLPLLVAMVPKDAVFQADGTGLAAMVNGVRIRVECSADLSNWELPVREVSTPDIPAQQAPDGWEIRAFTPDGNPENAFLRFALQFQDQ